MSNGGEYEPKDSRNVTGTAQTTDGRWSGDKEAAAKGGEYEPSDSRNVVGTAKTADGRWTKEGGDTVTGVHDGHPFTAEEAAIRAAKPDSDDPARGG